MFFGDRSFQLPLFVYILGTHEVQTCEVNNCTTPGRVNISCNFTENSEAMGYLSILRPTDDIFHELFVVASTNVFSFKSDSSSSDLKISVPWVLPASYNVVVFDIGSDGLLPILSGGTNYAADEKNVTVTDSGGGKRNLSEKLC